MFKSYKVRLLPTQEQELKMKQHVDISRFVWNYLLAKAKSEYAKGEFCYKNNGLRKIMREIKHTEEYSWLNNVSSHTIDGVCETLDKAFVMFFRGDCKYPRFKKKNRSKKSFPIRQDRLYFTDKTVNIEKIGKVEYKTNIDIPLGMKVCKFYNTRVLYEGGKWVLSLTLEYENQVSELNDFSIGIDLGVKKLAVISYGNNYIEYDNINKTKRIKNLKKKHKHIERLIARKYAYNNSHNVYSKKFYKSRKIQKLEKIAQEICTKIKNIRHNNIHHITKQIVDLKPKSITMENLCIRDMMKNKILSKYIQEQCFGKFKYQIKYKCERYGIEFIEADRYYPSSKMCSNCGYVKHDLKLTDRVYTCGNCGSVLDRDLNAAINLANYSQVYLQRFAS